MLSCLKLPTMSSRRLTGSISIHLKKLHDKHKNILKRSFPRLTVIRFMNRSSKLENSWNLIFRQNDL